jgi:toxin ParE1/3/4
MTSKPVILRNLAQQDIEAEIDYYAQVAGTDAALHFIEALRQAYALISIHPAAGSPRYAFELGLPGLRSVSLKRFPYLLFYIEQNTQIEVWRVLHAQRDIPGQMQTLEDE